MEVSVVVPARNAAAVLPAQLDALARQTFAGDWEVVVVDDRSDDATTAAVARAGADRVPNLRVVTPAEHRNVAHARNVGVGASRGAKLLFCDADDVVDDGWVAALAGALDHHALVAGAMDATRLNPPWVRASRPLPQRQGLMASDVPGWELLHGGGGNIGVARELFHAVGGFDDDPSIAFAEAADFFFRAQLAGAVPAFVPDAVVHVRLRGSLATTYLQARRWAEGSVALHRRFAPHGMPAPRWRRGLLAWAWVPVRLVRVRSRGDLGRWVHLLGWRVGRVRGSLRNRMLAF